MEHILIVWSSTDQIYFTLMDAKHLDYIKHSMVKSYKDHNVLAKVMEFIDENGIGESIVTQTYCTDHWFTNVNISEVIQIPCF